MQHCPHRRLQQSRHLNDLVPALASVVHHQPARGGVCRPHEGPRAAEEDGSNSILKDLRSAVTPWHDVADIATGYMNKSQSIDGIIGPHYANDLPRSVALKAEAAQSVRRAYKNASSAEFVGRFWFRESSQVVIKGNFHGVEGAKAVGSSGNYSDFVVEALNGTVGDFSFGSKPIQYQRLMGAQHPGHLFHRFQTAPHGPEAPVVEKATGPHLGFVLPEMGEGLLQLPGACGGQFAGEQGIQLLPGSPAYPAAAA